MTEFSKYGEIIARCMGYPEGEFIKVYERNREIQTDEIIESSQVATCLMYMMYTKYGETKGDFRAEWDGTMSALLREFKAITDTDASADDVNIDTKNKNWSGKEHCKAKLKQILDIGRHRHEQVRIEFPRKGGGYINAIYTV